MKQILEQYMQAIIAVIVIGSVAFVLLHFSEGDNHGLSKVIGAFVESQMETDTINRNDAFQEFYNRYTPVIVREDPYVMEAGKWIFPEECFRASDEFGQKTEVRIEGVWKEDGTPKELVLSDKGSFCLEETGIYWLSLSAEDARGYERSTLVKVFVNGGREG